MEKIHGVYHLKTTEFLWLKTFATMTTRFRTFWGFFSSIQILAHLSLIERERERDHFTNEITLFPLTCLLLPSEFSYRRWDGLNRPHVGCVPSRYYLLSLEMPAELWPQIRPRFTTYSCRFHRVFIHSFIHHPTTCRKFQKGNGDIILSFEAWPMELHRWRLFLSNDRLHSSRPRGDFSVRQINQSLINSSKKERERMRIFPVLRLWMS